MSVMLLWFSFYNCYKCTTAPVTSPIPLFVTWDLSMWNIWGLKIKWQHYRKVRITERLHKNHMVIMSPKSFSFNPVLERARVTQQGEPNFLPIVALMIRLAPTATKDNYMTVVCCGVSWVCDYQWVMASLGPSAVGSQSTASHFQSDIRPLSAFGSGTYLASLLQAWQDSTYSIQFQISFLTLFPRGS